jgi:uncharacterized membrane protein YsdA (DUF1294 family)/cold shock CspA family protein
MRFDGIIKSWNDDRGFGFIEPAQGGQDIFFHIKAFTQRNSRPQVNLPVSFEVEIGPQGKKRACNVAPIQPARARSNPQRSAPAQRGARSLMAIPAFLLVALVVSVLWRPPLWFAAIYALASGFTFLVYAADKSAAEQGRWRTPETTLHSLSIAGGWPGALLAQQFLRHKSTKAEFRSVFWGTVALNIAAFVYLCSPAGRYVWAAW